MEKKGYDSSGKSYWSYELVFVGDKNSLPCVRSCQALASGFDLS